LGWCQKILRTRRHTSKKYPKSTNSHQHKWRRKAAGNMESREPQILLYFWNHKMPYYRKELAKSIGTDSIENSAWPPWGSLNWNFAYSSWRESWHPSGTQCVRASRTRKQRRCQICTTCTQINENQFPKTNKRYITYMSLYLGINKYNGAKLWGGYSNVIGGSFATFTYNKTPNTPSNILHKMKTSIKRTNSLVCSLHTL